MKKIFPYWFSLCVFAAVVGACQKDEESISPEEKMLTAHTWTVAQVYVNDTLYHHPPQGLLGAKVKFNSTNPGTIAFLGTSYPNSVWMFDPNTKTKLIVNPYTQTQFSTKISKLEQANLWLRFEVTVPFLGVQLDRNTELRLTPAAN